MMNKKYQKLLVTFCVYDFILLGPLALPWVNQEYLGFLSSFDMALGGVKWPEFSSLHFVLIGLFGTLGVFWAYWRLKHSGEQIGRHEGYLRFALGSWAFAGALWSDSIVLLIVALLEFAVGVLHLNVNSADFPQTKMS